MTYITVVLKGGLGNQLFQVACGLAISKKYNCNFAIDKHHIQGRGQGNHPEKYYTNIFQRIIIHDSSQSQISTFQYYENGFAWQDICLHIQDYILKQIPKIVLHGYFQSDKYFLNFGRYIYDAFTPPQGLVETIRRDTTLFLRFPELDPSKIDIVASRCLIGVRRGDYLINTHMRQYYYPCGFHYYASAINTICADIYYVISDDISWCKTEFPKEFPEKRFVFLQESDDLVTFYFARLFRNYICANSSFHWWASYLSYYRDFDSDNDCKVVCPKTLFGPNGPLDYTDYFRNNMILL